MERHGDRRDNEQKEAEDFELERPRDRRDTAERTEERPTEKQGQRAIQKKSRNSGNGWGRHMPKRSKAGGKMER